MAAVADDDRFHGDARAFCAGVTYTVDTLADLSADFPGAELFFIAGADSIARLSEWRHPERLMKLARFVGVSASRVMPRPPSWSRTQVDTPKWGYPRPEVRRRVMAGAPVRYLVLDAVGKLIVQHALYLGGSDVRRALVAPRTPHFAR